MRVYQPPRALPLTLAEAKTHLRITHSADDTDISEMIRGAAEFCQTVSYRTFVATTWQMDVNKFPDRTFWLPRSPGISLESFRYRDSAGDWQTVSSSLYRTDFVRQPATIVRRRDSSWPSPDLDTGCVSVRWVAGMAAPATIDATTNTVTILGRAFADGDRVELTTSGTLPAELSTNQTYFVRDASGDATSFTCKLSATDGGAAIDVGANTGTHWIGSSLHEFAVARSAMRLVLGHLFAHRGDSDATAQMQGMPPQAMALLRSLEIGDEFTLYPEEIS